MPTLSTPDRAPADAFGPTSLASAATARPPKIAITPPDRWPDLNLAELWRYRELLAFFVWRDVKVRYKQTALGIVWAVLQPAMMMLVFTVFFGRLAGLNTGDLDKSLFYLSGLVPWMFFAAAIGAAANSVASAEHLVTKIYFPRLAIPLSAVAAASVDCLFACTLLAGVALALGVLPGWQILLAPFILLVIAALAAGIGTMLAAMTVVYRDVRYLIPFALQLGLFATPTIYLQPRGQGHEGTTIGLLLQVNPMTSLVSSFRAAALGGPIPWEGLGVATVVAVVVLVGGAIYFRAVEDRFADII